MVPWGSIMFLLNAICICILHGYFLYIIFGSRRDQPVKSRSFGLMALSIFSITISSLILCMVGILAELITTLNLIFSLLVISEIVMIPITITAYVQRYY